VKGDVLISAVAQTLGKLPWKVVYLGGSTTHLHLTDPAAPVPELTDDVDVVVEITSPVEFQIDLREKLKELSAKEDTSEDAPACRWLLGEIRVDIMTPNDAVLGFANRWYTAALETARPCALADGTHIDLIHAPVFIATKLEAYRDRGNGDCLASKDIEDIIAVFDGRPELTAELQAIPKDLQAFVREELSQLLADANLAYAVEGYLHEAPERASAVFDRLRAITRVTSGW
jgi:predicted nucleotidyltransferase